MLQRKSTVVNFTVNMYFVCSLWCVEIRCVSTRIWDNTQFMGLRRHELTHFVTLFSVGVSDDINTYQNSFLKFTSQRNSPKRSTN